MAMSASATRRLPRLLKTQDPFRGPPRARAFDFLVSEHTAKWLQDTSKKSPMQLINEVPPVKFEDSNPALGHPIEFICLDLEAPAVCKHRGLRYVQDHRH
ncbi:NADH dehydrogenase [ubiquinone] iron-sulfur protein 6, mitochondrial-like [Musa acuminata AAA Group]|uniref:NADH dehydrogenase [ubiquinone] iron-sulfur protein 6, mitochondrial-like n=1 Tax=Musa acuminata AAA Group TaxID=214697 RepID=UPI0031E149D4